MHITFTEQAVEQIKKHHIDGQEKLKLVYDSEGCGCAVSGVPTLWIVNQPGDRDLNAEGTPYDVLYEKKHEVYFEDRMSLDYRDNGVYILKSSGQIYNANMRLIDKRVQ
ncbi:iron-sulfur cluster biosynthesis family protein [Paenibacillus sp. UNC451MF]|uniref:iron-sulfur cluster biosynthesis family protein n=1 Tax=Paenibacillus sp. UNC451MF TaxID=1449063 RepID=UPI00048E6054|nr:iron-sulfur cluster biosynthesis family protein [Paenibacillus sp. UNC451MF]